MPLELRRRSTFWLNLLLGASVVVTIVFGGMCVSLGDWRVVLWRSSARSARSV